MRRIAGGLDPRPRIETSDERDERREVSDWDPDRQLELEAGWHSGAVERLAPAVRRSVPEP